MIADRIRAWEVVKVEAGQEPAVLMDRLTRPEANKAADVLNRLAIRRGKPPVYMTRYRWRWGRCRNSSVSSAS